MMIEQTVICEKATFPPRPFQFTKRPQLFVIKYLRMRRVHSFTLAPPMVLKLVIWNINIQLRLWHQNYTLVHYTDKQKQHTHFVAHICPFDKNPGGYPGWADTRWTVTITVLSISHNLPSPFFYDPMQHPLATPVFCSSVALCWCFQDLIYLSS